MEEHFIMLVDKIYNEDRAKINIYVPNNKYRHS